MSVRVDVTIGTPVDLGPHLFGLPLVTGAAVGQIGGSGRVVLVIYSSQQGREIDRAGAPRAAPASLAVIWPTQRPPLMTWTSPGAVFEQ